MAKVIITIEDKMPTEDDKGDVKIVVDFQPEIEMDGDSTPAQNAALSLLEFIRKTVEEVISEKIL